MGYGGFRGEDSGGGCRSWAVCGVECGGCSGVCGVEGGGDGCGGVCDVEVMMLMQSLDLKVVLSQRGWQVQSILVGCKLFVQFHRVSWRKTRCL